MRKFVRKLLVIALTVLFTLSGSVVMTSAKSSYSVSDINGKYKTQGRTQIINDGIRLEWSASGIEFQTNCSGNISITVDDVEFGYANSGETGGLFFTVIVDGVVQYEDKRIPLDNDGSVWKNNTEYPFHITKKGQTEFVIAKNLSKGTHTIEIYKQDEASDGHFSIKSVSLDGEILTAKSNRDFYIEFIGDSITTGHGNLVTYCEKDAPLYKDATRGWAYLTAKNLEADWSVIATSGITATKEIGWGGKTTKSMLEQYLYYDYNSKSRYSFEREPDVIIVALGTNDMWTYANCGATIADVQEGFIKLLYEIRMYNPDSKIIWIYGMMITSANNLIRKAVETMGGKNNGYYSLELPLDLSGGRNHPGLEIQPKYAQIICNHINKLYSNNDESYNSSDSDDSISGLSNGSFADSESNQISKATTSDFTASGENNPQITSTEANLNSETQKNNETQGITDAETSGSSINNNTLKGNRWIFVSVILVISIVLIAFGISFGILKKRTKSESNNVNF